MSLTPSLHLLTPHFPQFTDCSFVLDCRVSLTLTSSISPHLSSAPKMSTILHCIALLSHTLLWRSRPNCDGFGASLTSFLTSLRLARSIFINSGAVGSICVKSDACTINSVHFDAHGINFYWFWCLRKQTVSIPMLAWSILSVLTLLQSTSVNSGNCAIE